MIRDRQRRRIPLLGGWVLEVGLTEYTLTSTVHDATGEYQYCTASFLKLDEALLGFAERFIRQQYLLGLGVEGAMDAVEQQIRDLTGRVPNSGILSWERDPKSLGR